MDWSKIGSLLRRAIPLADIGALIYETIGLAALLISFSSIHRLIVMLVAEPWVRDKLNEVHGAFVVIYFIVFGTRLVIRFVFHEGFNVLVLVA